MSANTNQPTTGQDQTLVDLVESGRTALAAGDLDAARTAFERVVEVFPDEAVGHNNLGAFYMGIGDHAAAESAFARVCELLPDHASVRFNLGMARFRQERFEEAAEAFGAAHALDPDDAETLNNLGTTRFLCGEVVQARQDLEAALQRQPNYPSAIINLSDLEYAAGRTDKAIGICQAYLDHNHDAGVARQLLSVLDAENARQTALDHANADGDDEPAAAQGLADAATP
jgi:Flp pilus assembly protein TadD